MPVCHWLSGAPLCRDTPVCERSKLASEHAAAAKQQALRWAAKRAVQEAAEAECQSYLAEQVFGQMAAMAAQELEYRELGGGAPAPKSLRREWELLFVAGTLGTVPQLVSSRKTVVYLFVCNLCHDNVQPMACLPVSRLDHESQVMMNMTGVHC